MSELTRFRVARAPSNKPANSPVAVPASVLTSDNAADVGSNRRQRSRAKTVKKKVSRSLDQAQTLAEAIQIANKIVASSTYAFSAKSLRDPWLSALQIFDMALAGYAPNGPELSDLEKSLIDMAGTLRLTNSSSEKAAADLVAQPDWHRLQAVLGTSLVADVINGQHDDDACVLTRLILVMEIIAGFAKDPSQFATAERIRAALTSRVVTVPMKFLERLLAAHGSPFVRPPAFADFYVVREEWSCFVAGEIAYIENVLEGEKKERVHRRLDETEVTTLTSEETVSTEEQDTRTTDRSSLSEEASHQTELSVQIEGQVDTAGQYGPTHVSTRVGGGLTFSSSDSKTRAATQAREVVTQAVSRVSTTVRKVRTERKLTRVVETNRHKIDNSVRSSGNVVGIYRWVDQIKRAQVFRYAHRFMLEFELPEPGAYLRWLQQKRLLPKPSVDAPPSFTLANSPTPLMATAVTRGNYLQLAARFRAQNLAPPPAATIDVGTVIEIASNDKPPADHNTLIEFPPNAGAKDEIAIPKDYFATSFQAVLSAVPVLGKWHDNPVSVDHFESEAKGYHMVRADVTVAGRSVALRSTNSSTVWKWTPGGYGVRYDAAWVTTATSASQYLGRLVASKLPIAAVVGGCYVAAVSVIVHCDLDPAAFEQWQSETFDRLLAAYTSWKQNYDSWLEDQANSPAIRIDGDSGERNRQVVREEIKRQIIEMLIGQRFDGFEGLNQPMSPILGPVTNQDAARAAAPTIQFLEQAIEWSNLTYILYPYFWTARSRWPDLQGIVSNDADFATFLRSGSARVLVPAHPGFEYDILFYAVFRRPWAGGPIPLPADSRYVSVAEEIRELTQGPRDGEPGEMWEFRLPTTLVWLDSDSQLPKHNTNQRLAGKPDPALCKP